MDNINPEYFAYLESIRDELPDSARGYALDPSHYDLTSHSSLHDACLESFTVREPAPGDRNQYRSIEIEAIFLGPFHDRRMTLVYKEVQDYNIQSPAELVSSPCSMGHGDLLVHRFRMEPGRVLVHDLEFCRGTRF